jgi:hypothetical protein
MKAATMARSRGNCMIIKNLFRKDLPHPTHHHHHPNQMRKLQLRKTLPITRMNCN